MSGRTPDERPIRGGRFVRGALLAIAALFVARVAVGAVVGSAVHPVTVLAVIAGLAGGVAAVAASTLLAAGTPPWERLWTTAPGDGGDAFETTPAPTGRDRPPAPTDGHPSPLEDWRRTRLQLLFFGVAGGLYPWVFGPLLGVPGAAWAAVPTSLATGLLWAVGTFAVAALTHLATGTLTASPADARDWIATAAGHLAFGVVFGAVVGVWLPLFVV